MDDRSQKAGEGRRGGPLGPPENRLAVTVAVVSLLAGILILALAGGGDTAVIAASLLFGLAGVALVCLAFLLVGESDEEDRRRHPNG